MSTEIEYFGDYYEDKRMVEHGCCLETAIVRKCSHGHGMYGKGVMLICECDSEHVQAILRGLNGAKAARTAKEIVDQTIDIAAIIYRSRGYQTPPGFKFWESNHPHELAAWDAACQIQELMTNTDAEDALSELEDDSDN